MSKVSFAQRFGFAKGAPISNDFPKTARTALAYLLDDLANRDYERLKPKQAIVAEICRAGRQKPVDENQNETFFDQVLWHLDNMEWERVYTFCERAYERLLAPIGVFISHQDFNYDPEWKEEMPLVEVQKYFEAEINSILVEENLAYYFVDGQFQRRGRAQTQKNIQRVGTVKVGFFMGTAGSDADLGNVTHPIIANAMTVITRHFFDLGILYSLYYNLSLRLADTKNVASNATLMIRLVGGRLHAVGGRILRAEANPNCTTFAIK